ncbi:hypothetical protein ASPVEDRAFT_44233 [Aspergillus versicolor CBS 583.65]|uniref:CWF21 domain-containing protein n=1 Tax=Aspergillus versicolor CBS 583.65 TaxID=1036611 RepID=A0A1L9PTD0_ASPVE|nr:uncharacterized protein ASPVEDRAFT_44233 [Aspergillus versicolor CBS 583.65]OJJ04696.1 hypothetical protein ASPVEDRAFT_44233 [Aspergillus versicolor CBS 583.65]
MSSNVGLSTPRGSGTSGYVQKNHAFLRPRNFGSGAPYPPPSGGPEGGSGFKQRQPDQAILEHEQKREIEVKVLEERERLEDANERIEEGKGEEGEKTLSEEEIDEICEELRERLVKEMEQRRESGRGERDGKGRRDGKRGFKAYQVHELAEAKIAESERLRRALGIKEDASGEPVSARGEIERRREKERERERDRD